MKILSKFKGIAGDLIYSMSGLIVMNGVIQLVLYPFLNRQLGADYFGNVLTMLSIVAIMGSTFGTAANYSRMVSHTKGQDSNGDYNIFLLLIAVISIPVAAVGLIWMKNFNVPDFLIYTVLMIATVLRYYSDVEFRLNLNYKRFFIFYLLISIGYLLGIATFRTLHSWALTMLIGELFSVLFVVFTGSLYRGSLLKPSEHFRDNFKSVIILSGTELIATLILNADRLILQVFAGGVAVTVFYAATLIGKMISLISMPLNGVIMGHLSKYKGGLKPSMFVRICGAGAVFSLVMNVACVGVSYVFVRIMYADIFEQVVPYFWLANLGQIFYFISNTLTVILLRFTDEKYQLYINIIYFISFIMITLPMTAAFKLWGMAAALVIVNMGKVLVIAVVGAVQLKKKEPSNVDSKTFLG